MGHQETFASIAQRFGVSVGTAHSVVFEVMDLLIPQISNAYITWPNEQQLMSLAIGFHEKSPLLPAQIVGAVDCKEIGIIAPSIDCSSYFNRKQFYSIKLQVSCNFTAFIKINMLCLNLISYFF